MKRRARQFLVFTTNTLLEALRNKTIYAVIIASVLAMSMATTLGALSLQQDERVFNNLVYFVGMLFLVAIAIFQGVTAIHREIDTKTIFTVLSKPVPRGSFLLGKYVASAAILTFCAILMFGLKSLGALAIGYEVTAIHLSVYYAGLLQLFIILAVGFFFSTFSVSGPLLSALFTFCIFLIGTLTPQLQNVSRELSIDGNPAHHLLDITLYIVPDLEKLNLSYELAHRIDIPFSYLGHATLYAATTIAFLMLVSLLIFSRRDFA